MLVQQLDHGAVEGGQSVRRVSARPQRGWAVQKLLLDLPFVLVEQSRGDGGAVGVAAVQGGPANPGRARDVVHCHLLRTAGGEQVRGRAQHAGPVAGGVRAFVPGLSVDHDRTSTAGSPGGGDTGEDQTGQQKRQRRQPQRGPDLGRSTCLHRVIASSVRFAADSVTRSRPRVQPHGCVLHDQVGPKTWRQTVKIILCTVNQQMWGND